MVLSSDRVQLSIVDPYSPPKLDSCRNASILAISDYGDPDLFGNNLDGTHLLTIRDGVNNIMI